MREALSTLRPFRHPVYRGLWFCAFAVYMANWIQQIGAASIMAGLTPNPSTVALVQTMASLPGVLLSLPAGALADLVDRRRWFLFTQGMVFTVAVLIALVAWSGALSPLSLLMFTLLLGVGFALHGPAAQAVFTEVVPREELPEALALGSVAFNLSRVLGPAVAGALMAWAGGGLVYAVVAACSAWVVLYVWRWEGVQRSSQVAPERLFSAIRSGLRYLWHSPAAQLPLRHGALYVFGGSAATALLPVVARDTYGALNAFGILMGGMGLGGVLGVAGLPLMRRWPTHRVAAVCAAGFATVPAVLAMGLPLWVTAVWLVFGGAIWVMGVSTIFVVLQITLPDWVRGRVLSMQNLSYFAAMAGGAMVWGFLAELLGLTYTLWAAALFQLVSVVWHLLRPMPELPKPAVQIKMPRPSSGTHVPGNVALPWRDEAAEEQLLVVQHVYRVRPEEQARFQQLAHELGLACRRNGATFWRLYRDLKEPDLYIERYIVDSPDDLARQESRWTVHDHWLRQQLQECLVPGCELLTNYHVVQDIPVRSTK